MNKFIKKVILGLFSFVFAFSMFVPVAEAGGGKIVFDFGGFSDAEIYDLKIMDDTTLKNFLINELDSLCDYYLPQGIGNVIKMINNCIKKKYSLKLLKIKDRDFKAYEKANVDNKPVYMYHCCYY